MKKVDIRKVYVGEILKQGEVTKIQDNNIVLGHDPYYVWNYDDETQLGLFVRVLGGWKHILTDTIYQKLSKRTGNKHVINPDYIEEFVKTERVLANHIINKYKTFYMDMDVIKALEERINEEECISEDEDKSELNLIDGNKIVVCDMENDKIILDEGQEQL
jgi:hypothetical protein